MVYPPIDFICPLTKRVMIDPVSTPEGVNFERGAITEFLSLRSRCPVNGTPLRPRRLRTNTKLQWMILFWQSRNGTEEDKTGKESEVPEADVIIREHFICPLTRQVMVDPVTIREGMHFERSALLQFIEKYGEISPLSGQPLGQPCFFPNSKMAWDIKQRKLGIAKAKDSPTDADQRKNEMNRMVHILTLPTSKSEYCIVRKPSAGSVQDPELLKRKNQEVMSILDEVCKITLIK